jgi:hypothetical protein
MHDKSHESSGESRRDFLKKAGAVAWVVPTMQIVNMAGASAQTNGSVVDTTRPPTTTTTTTTTTKPPCVPRVCTIKAEWTGAGWSWSDGSLGDKPCVSVSDNNCHGGNMGAVISGDSESAKVTVPDHCTILEAAHKAGSEQSGEQCYKASAISDSRHSAWFTAVDHGISNIQLLVECCHDDD